VLAKTGTAAKADARIRETASCLNFIIKYSGKD